MPLRNRLDAYYNMIIWNKKKPWGTLRIICVIGWFLSVAVDGVCVCICEHALCNMGERINKQKLCER